LRYISESQGIEDVKFTSDYVCRPGEYIHALLVFTIAVDAKLVRQLEVVEPEGRLSRLASMFWTRRRFRRRLRQAEADLYTMAAEHIAELVSHQRLSSRECLVLAQAFNRRAAATLEAFGFRSLGSRSADGEELYELRIETRP
jgi:hypothetical protein